MRVRRLLLTLALLGCEAPPATPTVTAPTVTAPTVTAPTAAATTRANGARRADRSATTELTALRAAIADHADGRWVQGRARVKKTLPDDNEGSRHQRFLLAVDGGTVLVAHNIDLAPRAPVRVGGLVGFRGEFVWNDKGGVLHWTHHDPKGKPGGWLEVGGRRYE